MRSVNPRALSSGHLEMATMAEAATSAAEPWMGVLMAALSACPCLREVEGSSAGCNLVKSASKEEKE